MFIMFHPKGENVTSTKQWLRLLLFFHSLTFQFTKYFFSK